MIDIEKLADKYGLEINKAGSMKCYVFEIGQLQAFANELQNEVIEMCAFELEQHLDGSDIGDDNINNHICSSAKILRNLKVKG